MEVADGVMKTSWFTTDWETYCVPEDVNEVVENDSEAHGSLVETVITASEPVTEDDY